MLPLRSKDQNADPKTCFYPPQRIGRAVLTSNTMDRYNLNTSLELQLVLREVSNELRIRGYLQRYKWHIIVTLTIAVTISIWIASGSRATPSQWKLWLWVVLLSYWGPWMMLLAYVCTIVASFRDSSAKLEEVRQVPGTDWRSAGGTVQSTRLSEKTKAIAFAMRTRASLQEAVMQKLNARDYDAAYDVMMRLPVDRSIRICRAITL